MRGRVCDVCMCVCVRAHSDRSLPFEGWEGRGRRCLLTILLCVQNGWCLLTTVVWSEVSEWVHFLFLASRVLKAGLIAAWKEFEILSHLIMFSLFIWWCRTREKKKKKSQNLIFHSHSMSSISPSLVFSSSQTQRDYNKRISFHLFPRSLCLLIACTHKEEHQRSSRLTLLFLSHLSCMDTCHACIPSFILQSVRAK